MPQEFDDLPFQVDHILAQQHGGMTTASNTCLACVACNKHKGPNLSGVDPVTHRVVRLFNPRRSQWNRRFRWNGVVLVGKTAGARATVAVLRINSSERIALRSMLMQEEAFPPRIAPVRGAPKKTSI